MTFSSSDLAHLIVALVLLLAAAHGGGFLFRRLRQPPVIGEVLGGLLLGPTLLGALLPGWERWIFADSAATATALGAIFQLGLLLLLFSSGAEIRALFHHGERKAVALITLTGTALPFVFALLLLRVIDVSPYLGPAQSRSAFTMVFAIGVAVTSIPVISRILHDLGILESPFARIILSSAVVEDVLLYVLVAIALSQVGKVGSRPFGVPGLLGIAGTSHVGMAYYTAVPLAFLLISLLVGPLLFRWGSSCRFNFLRQGSSIAHLLVILLLMTGVATSLGVTPMFGALMAGIITGQPSEEPERPRHVIATFSFAFFIPIYFASVGLKLDLLHSFS
ncbi:MAG TPA: cation:proton antiporter, partial [Thermoanaerobaculia bacterium]|nr:cation:proton antiporter [Thermoanaerobaculia bacterium]